MSPLLGLIAFLHESLRSQLPENWWQSEWRIWREFAPLQMDTQFSDEIREILDHHFWLRLALCKSGLFFENYSILLPDNPIESLCIIWPDIVTVALGKHW